MPCYNFLFFVHLFIIVVCISWLPRIFYRIHLLRLGLAESHFASRFLCGTFKKWCGGGVQFFFGLHFIKIQSCVYKLQTDHNQVVYRACYDDPYICRTAPAAKKKNPKNGTINRKTEMNTPGYQSALKRITIWKRLGRSELVLNLSNLALSVLPPLPDNLEILECNQNQLTSLPELPASLQVLICAQNQLTRLPESLPASLQVLICVRNQLTRLPERLPAFLTLSCDGNQLTSLPELPASLQYLTCSENNLTSLPELPASLQKISCHQNQLTSLPERLPASLQELSCHTNQLTSLPELPASLLVLECDVNRLTQLPELPASLKFLSCSGNRITSLPKLPNSLVGLRCNYNKLTRFHELPISLVLLECNNNSFVEPFATYYTTYRQTNDIDQLRQSIHAYYLRIKAEGRNVSSLKQTLGRQGRLPEALEGEVASFLSGKILPSGRSKPTNQQLAELKANAEVGGSRKKRDTRRRNRRGLKGGKGGKGRKDRKTRK